MTLKRSQTTSKEFSGFKNVLPASPNKTSSAQSHKYPTKLLPNTVTRQLPMTWVKQHPKTPQTTKTTKLNLQALPCTNWFHLVPNWFLPGSYRFPMGSLVHRSVPTNLKWLPNCSPAHTLFQDRFKDVQVGSRWFSTLYILSPNFHTKRSSHDASGSKLGIV